MIKFIRQTKSESKIYIKLEICSKYVKECTLILLKSKATIFLLNEYKKFYFHPFFNA